MSAEAGNPKPARKTLDELLSPAHGRPLEIEEVKLIGRSLLASWLGCIFWPLNWILIEVPCLVDLGFKRRWKAFAVCAVLTPYTLILLASFVGAVLAYKSGTLALPAAPTSRESRDARNSAKTYWRKDWVPLLLWHDLGERLGAELMYRLSGPLRKADSRPQ